MDLSDENIKNCKERVKEAYPDDYPDHDPRSSYYEYLQFSPIEKTRFVCHKLKDATTENADKALEQITHEEEFEKEGTLRKLQVVDVHRKRSTPIEKINLDGTDLSIEKLECQKTCCILDGCEPISLSELIEEKE